MVFSQHEAFIKKESTWGTGVDPTSTTTALAEVLGATTNIDYRIENTVGAVNPASSAYPTEISYHEAKVSGSIDFMFINAMPFVPMLGTVTAAEPVEGQAPYTWTITPSATPAPFTTTIIANGTNDKCRQITGCLAQSLSFSMKLGEPITGKLDFVAKGIDIKEDAYTLPTAITLDDAKVWNPKDTTISIGSVSNCAYITALDFTISRTADVGFNLTAREASHQFAGKFEAISGSFSAWIADSATANEIEQLVVGGTSINETLTQTNDIVIDAGYTDTTADTWKITIDDALIQSVDATFPLDTKHEYKFNFSAEKITSVLWESPVTVVAGAW